MTIKVYYICKIPVLLLLVNKVSAIEGQLVPPMLAKFDGVPSPLDHQAICLVIALIRGFVV
jgi:hypothetical protein